MDSGKSKDLGTTAFYCPRCQQRCTRMPYTGDFVHECHGSETLSNEDVLVIGTWEDYTGSAVVPNTNLNGQVNTLQGTRAGIEGERNYPRTSRGFNKTVYRTRKHLHYIPDSNFANKMTKDSFPIESEKV